MSTRAGVGASGCGTTRLPEGEGRTQQLQSGVRSEARDVKRADYDSDAEAEIVSVVGGGVGRSRGWQTYTGGIGRRVGRRARGASRPLVAPPGEDGSSLRQNLHN